MASRRLIHLMSSTVPDAKARHTLDICTLFRDKGWSVTAYTRDARSVDSFFVQKGISLRPLAMAGISDIFSLRSLARDLRIEEKGAILHAHRIKDAMLALGARFFASRTDIKVVLTVHNSRFQKAPRILKGIFRRLDAVIFTSESVAESFSRVFPVGEGKGRIIHYTLPVPDHAVSDEPATGPVTAMWHGRMVPGKGLENLIDILPSLKGKRIRLRLAGNGNPDYVDSLRRRAAVKGVNQMIDWVKNVDDVFALISMAHFGVLPASGEDLFGYPNLEYMAAGRAQIVTKGIVQSEYLADNRDSLIIAPDDPQALSEAIQRLASDSSLRRTLGEAAARKFRSDLSWERFAVAMEEIYTS